MSSSDSALEPLTSIKIRKRKISAHECRICGAPAEYSHFGVISCLSCKIFFRRHGNAGQRKFICDVNGQCEININNRHICNAYRLDKCFKCGMSTDLFRASRRNKPNTKALINVQIQHQPKRLRTLNLLQYDQSLLSSSQWTLLSNLFNAYKESQFLSIGHRLIDTQDVIQSTNVNYETLIQKFIICIYETTGTYLRYNDDLCKSSSNDRSIMLRNAADSVSCLGSAFAIHHCNLLSLDAFLNVMIIKYGKGSVDIHHWVMKFLDPDVVIVKLAFSLFAVTENTYSYTPNISNDLTNLINILEIQSKYVEITWKYLLYRYGYYEAVKRFLNLTCWLKAMTVFMFHVQSLTLHINDVDSRVEQTELTLILDDVDQILETNK